MDERKSKSDEIEEWVKEFFPDNVAEIGMWQHPERTSVKTERPNTCQLSVDSHAYPTNAAKHEQEPLKILQHTDQQTLQKMFETKGGVALERAHPRSQIPTLHQSQNLTLADQLKPENQTQAMLLGPLHGMSRAGVWIWLIVCRLKFMEENEDEDEDEIRAIMLIH